MNYKIAMIPLLLCGMFASCNDNEELIKTNPDFVEAGYGALTLTLKYPEASQTKAVGDTLVGFAYPAEKTIKSVAFFVKTDPENVGGELLYGSFGSYFSGEELLAANGLQEELEEVIAGTPGEYTAKILHRSDGWKDPQVIVIANYIENGLTDKLKAVTDWETLQSVVSETLLKNPQTPLLMYATKTIDAWKRASGRNGGGLTSADIEMERLVSRIDIRNNAYNNANEAKGFVLTSAQLIRPKTASYLLPSTGLIPRAVSAVPFGASGTVKEGAIGPIAIQELDSLYAYENDNQDPSSATAIQINGTYRGGNISKVIEMKKADGVGTIGDPIALVRNHRYVVNINAAPDSTDITWNIVVKEWGEGDTIKVKGDTNKPDLTKALATAQFNAGTSSVSWDKSKVFDITNTTGTDATLDFTVSYSTPIVAEVKYGFDTDGSSVVKTEDIVKTGTPVITYGAATVETPIKITIPRQSEDERVPLDIYVILRNAVNPSVYDSITIKSRPVYNGVTNALPVLMKDGKYWAPINAGATNTTNKAATSGDITAACGKLFQWGRYSGVKATASVSDIYSGSDRPVAVDGVVPDMSKWDNLFIKSSSSTPNTLNNWLQFVTSVDNPADADMQKAAWYQQLWNANEGVDNADVVKTDADPCPKGWRVPTGAEWIAMGADGTTLYTWDATNLRLTVPGKENGKNLLLPATGNRNPGAGSSGNQGVYGEYWSSSVPDASTKSNHAYFKAEAKLRVSMNNRGYGLSVRCIQE